MFEQFRQSLRDLMDRSTPPEDRRAGLAQMKQTLVQARMGLDDLRSGIAQTRQRLAAEARELETVRRRKGLAAGINDAETVALAEKYEARHAERTGVLARKLSAQASLTVVHGGGKEIDAALALAGIPKRQVDGLRVTLGDRELRWGLVEREVSEMTSALKGALAGVPGGKPLENADVTAELDAMLDGSANVADEIDALGRASNRSARDADADRRLAELKRKMGK